MIGDVARPSSSSLPAAAGGRSRSERTSFWLILAGIAAIALVLRAVGLGARALWVDEATSWIYAAGSPGELVARLRLDSGPPLYYLLLGGWQRVAGASELALRALSVLAGVALVPLVGLAGRDLLGRRGGLVAAWIAAVSPLGVHFSQEARSYVVLSLAGLVGMYGLLRALRAVAELSADSERDPEKGKLGGWLALTTAGLAAAAYLHNYGLLLLAAASLVALAAPVVGPGLSEGRRRWLPLAAVAAAGIAYLPWLPVLRAQLANPAATVWMTLPWDEMGLSGALAGSLAALSPGGGGPPYLGLPPAPGGWRTAAVLLAGAALLLGVGWIARGALAAGRLWLAAYLLLPPLAAALYSIAAGPIYLPGRLDALLLPPFCLVVAAALERPLAAFGRVEPSAPRTLAVGLAAWTLLAAAGLTAYYGAQGAAGERRLAAAIGERLEPGDAVIATSLAYAPLAYELRRRPAGVALYAFPPEMAEHPGRALGVTGPAGSAAAAAAAETNPSDAATYAAAADRLLSTLAEGPRRLVLALYPDRAGAVLVERLLAHPRRGRSSSPGEYELRLIEQPVTLFVVELR